MANASSTAGLVDRSLLDRLLSVSSRVEAGEGRTALLLGLNVFLLLGAYYVLKTVREALILSEAGAEIKSYASAAMAVLFLIIVPIYGAIASKVNRVWLIGLVLLFFISNLSVFFFLATAGVQVGVYFYIWLGIFNMLAVAQFWAFANDIYSEAEGKRLFPIVGIGASVGALVGSGVASLLFKSLGPFLLMGLAACVLFACIALTVTVHRREAGRRPSRQASAPLKREGGFRLVFQNRYLLLIAALVFLLNLVNTTGEYLLGRLVTEQAHLLAGTGEGALEVSRTIIGEFYGNFYFLANLAGFLIQTFLVARMFKWIGVRGALFVLPLIAFGAYSLVIFLPVLAIVKVAKILENSTDYSLNNTVRAALFLPTSREAKYKAKAAIDTFFVRAGDMSQAGIVYAGTALGLGVSQFAMVLLVMVGGWLLVARGIFKEHRLLRENATTADSA